MSLDVQVTTSGPLFTGGLERAIGQGLEDGLDETARVGVTLVRFRLAGALRHPTGHYVSQIQVERAGTDRAVTDGGIIYGPWLEGVSERNRSTRFKGYATFRRATAEIDRRAAEIVSKAIDRRIGSL